MPLKEIPLTRGLAATVDDADYGWLTQHKWFALRGNRGLMYAARQVPLGARRQKCVLMHRQLTDAPPGSVVDHVSGDSLDNSRANLRVGTQAMNCQNRQKSPGMTSPFMGVCWHSQHRKWCAYVRLSGKPRFLGLFLDPQAAARARDAAVIAAGTCHRLNFPT